MGIEEILIYDKKISMLNAYDNHEQTKPYLAYRLVAHNTAVKARITIALSKHIIFIHMFSSHTLN